jgi:uroporphyrinogen-III synthase
VGARYSISARRDNESGTMTGRAPALSNVSIVVTRAAHQNEPWVIGLTKAGATVVVAPAIGIEPPPDTRPLVEALHAVLDDPHEGQWVAFTSANAVVATVGAAHIAGVAEALAGVSLAAVGDATAAVLSERLRTPDLVGSIGTAAGLAVELGAREDVFHVLFPTAHQGRLELAEGLLARGIGTTRVAAYQSCAAPLNPAVRDDVTGADVIVLASPSAARSVAAWGLSRLPAAVAIGAVTGNAMMDLGWPVAAAAVSPSINGVIDACLAAVGR